MEKEIKNNNLVVGLHTEDQCTRKEQLKDYKELFEYIWYSGDYNLPGNFEDMDSCRRLLTYNLLKLRCEYIGINFGSSLPSVEYEINVKKKVSDYNILYLIYCKILEKGLLDEEDIESLCTADKLLDEVGKENYSRLIEDIKEENFDRDSDDTFIFMVDYDYRNKELVIILDSVKREDHEEEIEYIKSKFHYINNINIKVNYIQDFLEYSIDKFPIFLYGRVADELRHLLEYSCTENNSECFPVMFTDITVKNIKDYNKHKLFKSIM